MKNILLLFFLFLCNPGFSQDTTDLSRASNAKVSLSYLRSNNIPLSKEDSLNFEIKDGDTIVSISIELLTQIREKQTRVPYEPREKDFLETYEQVVFGTPDKWDTATLKIWKEPVRLYFDPSVPKEHQKALLGFANKLSEDIDSLQIQKVSKRSKANYLIFYRHNEADFDLEPRIRNNRNSGFYVNWNGQQQLNRGIVKINAYKIPLAKDQLDLLKYHFFKALGYFYSSPKLPCKSYLSSCPVKRVLVKEDLELLKYHYSYGIAKGVDIENFRKIHQDYQELLEKYPDSRHYIVHKN